MRFFHGTILDGRFWVLAVNQSNSWHYLISPALGSYDRLNIVTTLVSNSRSHRSQEIHIAINKNIHSSNSVDTGDVVGRNCLRVDRQRTER